MYIDINVKYRYYCLILMELEFSGHILGKNAIISKFVMIRPVGAKLLHTDRQTVGHSSRSSQLCERA
jgi:hypothetical protein